MILAWTEEVNCNVDVKPKSTQRHQRMMFFCNILLHCLSPFQKTTRLISGLLHYRSFRSDQKLFPVQVYKPERKRFLFFVLCQTGVLYSSTRDMPRPYIDRHHIVLSGPFRGYTMTGWKFRHIWLAGSEQFWYDTILRGAENLCKTL